MLNPPRKPITIKTSVFRGQVNEFIRSLGFDAAEISHVEITPQAIYLTSYLRDQSGQIYTIKEGGNVRPATQTQHVAIKDD